MDKQNSLDKNTFVLLQPEKTEEKMVRFAYLSTTMALNKEEQEEKGSYQLGNKMITDIF